MRHRKLFIPMIFLLAIAGWYAYYPNYPGHIEPGTNNPEISTPGGLPKTTHQSPMTIGSILTNSAQTTAQNNDPSKPAEIRDYTPPRTPSDKLVTIDNKQYPLRTYQPLALPNDPLVNQWWVTQASFEQTWEIPRGNNETVLAIIDTGFALRHEEFTNRWYINPGESGPATSQLPSKLNCSDRGLALDASCNLIDDNNDGIVDNETGPVNYQNPSKLNCSDQVKPLTKDCNMVDDDNNSLADDVTGWDFINNDYSVQAGQLNPIGSGTTHGTLVTGVAAATGNNAKGIAGADWGTTILPIQALDDDSYGDTLSVGRAIFYAVEQGADVISLSLGSTLPDDYVKEAVRAATAAGIIVVAASGNDGCDCMLYPANYPEVVAVGALNTSSQLASFSSYGANLDIVAPGTQITSATWTSSNPTSAYASGVNGTSFSAPLVGGMLTRILSHQPTATPLQLRAALTESTNRLTLSPTIPHDLRLGYGTLDALRATNRMITPKNPYQLYSFTPVSQGDFLPSIPAIEAPSNDFVTSCDTGTIGGSPILELTKTGSQFFSISTVEALKAQQTGYTARLFAHACLQQPHDTALINRQINIFHEFKNIYTKL